MLVPGRKASTEARVPFGPTLQRVAELPGALPATRVSVQLLQFGHPGARRCIRLIDASSAPEGTPDQCGQPLPRLPAEFSACTARQCRQ
ncbi:hypothetical protein ABZ871_33025 [Streptomyces populi]